MTSLKLDCTLPIDTTSVKNKSIFVTAGEALSTIVPSLRLMKITIIVVIYAQHRIDRLLELLILIVNLTGNWPHIYRQNDEYSSSE
jgi:hypothetical protein